MHDRPDVKIDAPTSRAVDAGLAFVPRKGILGKPRGLAAGDVVDLKNRAYVARGIWDPDGPTAVRVLTRDRELPIDLDFWRTRIAHALDLRRRILPLAGCDAWRAAHGAGDGLPGLAIDSLSSYTVLHLATESLRPHLPTIVTAVKEAMGPRGIYEKRRTTRRGHHLGGSAAPDNLPVREGKMRFIVRLSQGLTTGLPLDQREVRRNLTRYARGRRVAVCHAGAGTLAVAAALAGAPRVVSIEPVDALVEQARENLATNGLPPEAHRLLSGDPVDVLDRLGQSARGFDLLVLDLADVPLDQIAAPPPATKAKSTGKSGSKSKSKKKAASRSGKKAASKPKPAATRPVDPAKALRRHTADLLATAIGAAESRAMLGVVHRPGDLPRQELLALARAAAVKGGREIQFVEEHHAGADFAAGPREPGIRDLGFLLFALR